MKLTTWWLKAILIFYPFFTLSLRYFKSNNAMLAYVVRFIDEGTIVIFSLLLFVELYKNKVKINRSLLMMAIPIAGFFISGIISGMINENRLDVTILGTIDYIKYFFVIFIYAIFIKDFDDFSKIFRVLLVISLIMSTFALIEEVWALIFRYVLGKDILDPIVYIFRKPPLSAHASLGAWRFGLFRAASFMKSTNIFGYYTLFILTVYLFINRKVNPLIYITLAAAVLVTVSRTACMGLLLLVVFSSLMRKTERKIIIIPAICFFMLTTLAINVYVKDIDTLGIGDGVITYREFAKQKGMQIWNDYPLLGIGPGMFGGVISKIFVSPVYSLYNFSFGYIETIGGIDQFWPQVFAEVGTIGFIFFVWIILSLIYMLSLLKQNVDREDMKDLTKALLVFLMVIYVYTFGTGFNTTAILFSYCAFVGITMGSSGNPNIINKCPAKNPST